MVARSVRSPARPLSATSFHPRGGHFEFASARSRALSCFSFAIVTAVRSVRRPDIGRLSRSVTEWLFAIYCFFVFTIFSLHCVFLFRVLNRLPRHVARLVWPAAHQRYNVVNDPARAGAGSCAGRWTRVLTLELSPRGPRSMKAAMRSLPYVCELSEGRRREHEQKNYFCSLHLHLFAGR
jgi:hypothetical protein